MSASVNANAFVAGTSNGHGGFNYTITLDNTGSTTIGTFWFGWVPGADFLSQDPTSIGAPAGWGGSVVPIGDGFSIEWTASSQASFIHAGGASSSFTFSSTETPAQLAASSTVTPGSASTTSFVYAGAPFATAGLRITPSVGGTTEAATGVLTPSQIGPGEFQYTITLTDTGNTTVGTFWFAWDDVPDQDFMSVQPTGVGSPTNWKDAITSHDYPGGGVGYGIEWSSSAPSADLIPNGESSSFTFDSSETPAQFAAVQQFNDPSFGTTFQSTSSFVYSGAAEATPGGNFIVEVACFRMGTRIRTLSGDVPIEALRAGHLVVTAAGEVRPVRWTGRRVMLCRNQQAPEQTWPVRVAAGALGFATPGADLYLSPDHALFLDGVLVPVKHLVNGTSIAVVPTDAVIWHHLELDSHDVILAEGAPAESYLDTGDRAKFAGGEPRLSDVAGRVRGQFAREARSDLELVITGPVVEAIRRRLADRAGLLDEVALADRVA